MAQDQRQISAAFKSRPSSKEENEMTKGRLTYVGPTPEESAARIQRILEAARRNTSDPNNEVSKAHNERALALRGGSK